MLLRRGSSGARRSRGRRARSACWACRTTPARSGAWPRAARAGSPPWCRGRACPTTTATAAATAASCRTPSSTSGGSARWSSTSTAAPARSAHRFHSAATAAAPAAGGQEDTLEGDLPEALLAANRRDQTADNAAHRFRDEPYYASKDYALEDIAVPVLSVANWGGILLHLRGNVEGYARATAAPCRFLRFITGRHDLPFYYRDEVEVQRSFLDAFLKGDDRAGWSVPGAVPPVTLTLRRGNVGFNDAEKERAYEKRAESAWPLPGTVYTRFHLTPARGLTQTASSSSSDTALLSYRALGTLDKPEALRFSTAPFEAETEITGHLLAHLNVSMTPDDSGSSSSSDEDKDIDLFVTLRHLDPSGNEIFYTGTAGDPVPLCKGWLRVSMRRVHDESPLHRPWLPHREYLSTDFQPVRPGDVYGVDVEIWPTNVVVDRGGVIVFEVASGDTQGSGLFQHASATDR